VINFFNEDIDFPDIDTYKYIKWIYRVLKNYNYVIGDINYIFCSDNYILNINKEYLNHDYFTDIITFNYNENDAINSDIFISLHTVEENSFQYNTSFQSELSRVIIHGILHLVGFNDSNDQQQQLMTQKEDEALSLLSL
jgi:probable rRNA maturation factor